MSSASLAFTHVQKHGSGLTYIFLQMAFVCRLESQKFPSVNTPFMDSFKISLNLLMFIDLFAVIIIVVVYD
jgi:hypothetical protein